MAGVSVASCIEEAAKNLGYGALEEEQKEAISQFVAGRDVFVALPGTGHCKSLCYCCLPYVFDHLRSVEKKSIVLVVSPLAPWMKDQIADYSSRGLPAAYVSAEPGNRDMKQGVIEGRYQFSFYEPRVTVY